MGGSGGADRCGATRGIQAKNGGVGFNPFRQQKRRSSDYVLVAAAVAITLLLVLWALIPR